MISYEKKKENCRFLALTVGIFIWEQLCSYNYFQFAAEIRVMTALGFYSSSTTGGSEVKSPASVNPVPSLGRVFLLLAVTAVYGGEVTAFTLSIP